MQKKSEKKFFQIQHITSNQRRSKIIAKKEKFKNDKLATFKTKIHIANFLSNTNVNFRS